MTQTGPDPSNSRPARRGAPSFPQEPIEIRAGISVFAIAERQPRPARPFHGRSEDDQRIGSIPSADLGAWVCCSGDRRIWVRVVKRPGPFGPLPRSGAGGRASTGAASLTDGTLWGGVYVAEFIMRMSTVPSVVYVGPHASWEVSGVSAAHPHNTGVVAAANKGTTIDTSTLDFGLFLSAQGAGLAVLNGAINRAVAPLGPVCDVVRSKPVEHFRKPNGGDGPERGRACRDAGATVQRAGGRAAVISREARSL